MGSNNWVARTTVAPPYAECAPGGPFDKHVQNENQRRGKGGKGKFSWRQNTAKGVTFVRGVVKGIEEIMRHRRELRLPELSACKVGE